MFRYLYKKFFENKPKVRVPHTKGLALTDINIYGEESESRQWIGVDLDGTLAFADPWKGFEHIGKPVPTMLKRVNVWIEMGYRVKIVTARTESRGSNSTYKKMVRKVYLPQLEITNCKDMDMIELWMIDASKSFRILGIQLVQTRALPKNLGIEIN